MTIEEQIAEIDKTIELLKRAKAELKQKLYEEKIMGDLIDRKDLENLMVEHPDFVKYLKIVNNIYNSKLMTEPYERRDKE